jgi:hypothetical protein
MEEVLGHAFGAENLSARREEIRAEIEARAAAKRAGGEAQA